MKDGVKLGLLGIVLGLAGAIALTRVMVSLLFEVNPTDPATLIGVALLLAAVSLTWILVRNLRRRQSPSIISQSMDQRKG